MSRAGDVAALAEAIRVDLADGAWHKAAGLGGWGHQQGTKSAALNLLLHDEVIEMDGRDYTYRLVPQPAPRQTTVFDEGVARGE